MFFSKYTANPFYYLGRRAQIALCYEKSVTLSLKGQYIFFSFDTFGICILLIPRLVCSRPIHTASQILFLPDFRVTYIYGQLHENQ